ncbi:YsxB [Bacillus licheniformis]|nr:YsxB [Bacillus licheniformis]
MIHAKITRSRSNKDILGFEMSGHANFAEHGQDLVCAGASAVAFGAVNAVMKLTGIEPVIDLGEDGGFYLSASRTVRIVRLLKRRSSFSKA